MKEYRVAAMPVPDWERVESVELSHAPWLRPNTVRAWAQACHNTQTLFVRMTAREEPVRATLTGPLEQVCNDSCLEFFFAPVQKDARYLNFEWNPLGTLYLGFGSERQTRVRQLVRDPALFQPSPFRTAQGWGIEFQIPLSFLQLYFPEFSFSGCGEGNFYKCGDETQSPHYLAWAPLRSSEPDFHRRQDFGRLCFDTMEQE